MTISDKFDDIIKHTPSQGERYFTQSVDYLVNLVLAGRMKGMAIAAINENDEVSCFYINSDDSDVLSEPISQLRVIYETNRSFGNQDTSPENNRSYRSH